MKKLAITYMLFLFCLESIAQNNTFALSQKFDDYQSVWRKTKLHLRFNQEKFSPGDTAFFKSYFLYEDLTGVKGKQVVNLDVIDKNGESKLRSLFSVTDGVGYNQIVIPSILPPGIYLIVAHSSWMKNFDPALIFRRNITIVNKNSVIPISQNHLRANVEGGHLIAGVLNKISVRTGKPDTEVQLVDSDEQEILRTPTNKNGLASVSFTPTKATYFVRTVGDASNQILLKTENDGCTLSLGSSPVGPLIIRVASPVNSSLRNEELLVFITAQGKIFKTATLRQGTKDFAELQFPQSDLAEGVAHVSLVNNAGRLLASRDFYHQAENLAQVTIQLAKRVFSPREKVQLQVSLSDNLGQPIVGEFSIRAVSSRFFGSKNGNTLSDELRIFSEGGERLFIDRSDSTWFQDLDNFLINTTKEEPWKEIVSTNVTPRFAFSNLVQKTGSVYFADTGKPVPNGTDVMFYLQQSRLRFQTRVEQGKVWLALPDLTGSDELMYIAETHYYLNGEEHGEEIPRIKIAWEDEPVMFPAAMASKQTAQEDEYGVFNEKRKLIDRSYSQKNLISNAFPSNKDFEVEINGADVMVNIQDYFVFPTMAELIKEVIPSLQYRKQGGRNSVLINLPESMWAMRSGNPVYIIDGVATKNTEFFLALKPADLITVKIVSNSQKLSRFGIFGKNGIILIQTKDGNLREPLADPSMLIEGVTRAKTFKELMPLLSKSPSLPDFKSTIFWNPSIKTDASGKAMVEFYCSDDIGKMKLFIEGIAASVKPFSAEEEIEVMPISENN